MRRSEARTCLRSTVSSQTASQRRPAARSTSSSRTARLSTSPAATWLSGARFWRSSGLRRAFPDCGRRRRHLLAAPERGLDNRLRSGSDGVAPPSQVDSCLRAAATRIWQGRGASRAQMAGALQPQWPRALVGQRLPGAGAAGARPPPVAYLLRNLGKRALPVDLRARTRHARLAAPHAGVVSPDCRTRRDDGVRIRRAAAPLRCPRPRHSVLARPARPRCARSRLAGYVGSSGRLARFAPTACRADEGDPGHHVPSSPPAAHSPLRSAAARAHALADARSPDACTSGAAQPRGLERELGVACRASRPPRRGAPSQAGVGPQRWEFRLLGPRGAGRGTRRRPHAHGRRGARAWTSTPSLPRLAAHPGGGHRVGRARRPLRSPRSRGSFGGASIFGALAIALAFRILRECAAAVALLLRVPAEQAYAQYPLPTVLAERARHAGRSEREILVERRRAANLRGGGKG
jgi:hypothetical protein